MERVFQQTRTRAHTFGSTTLFLRCRRTPYVDFHGPPINTGTPSLREAEGDVVAVNRFRGNKKHWPYSRIVFVFFFLPKSKTHTRTYDNPDESTTKNDPHFAETLSTLG